MHKHPGHFRVGEQARHVGIGSPAGDVVDNLGAVLQRRLCHLGVHGVDAYCDALSGKFFDYGKHT